MKIYFEILSKINFRVGQNCKCLQNKLFYYRECIGVLKSKSEIEVKLPILYFNEHFEQLDH